MLLMIICLIFVNVLRHFTYSRFKIKKNKAHFFVVKFVFFPFVGLSNSAGSFSSPSLSGPSKSAKSTTRPFCCRNSDNDEADDDDEYDAGDDDDDVESRRGDRSP